MNKAQIIKHLDEALFELCTAHPNYQAYRIGSSLFEHLIPILDIDYLLINVSSTVDFKSQILHLKNNFSGTNFLKAAISTYEPFLNEHFLACRKNISLLFNQEMVHFFGFGPIPMPENHEILVLHLAGPMNLDSTNFFFKQFPLFHLIWSRYHIQLGSKDFITLINNPHYTDQDVIEEYKRIYTRANAVDSFKVKKQCLKRLLLVDLVLHGHKNPFVESFERTNAMDLNEVLAELGKYSTYI